LGYLGDEWLRKPIEASLRQERIPESQHPRRQPIMPLGLGDEAKFDERQEHAPRHRAVDTGARSHLSEAERPVHAVKSLDDGKPAGE
jgi:hypothetical protein